MAPKSELNGLLLKLDSLLSDGTPAGKHNVTKLTEILDGFVSFMRDQDREVHRDLFDGVSNETRRAVVAGFITLFATQMRKYLTDPAFAESLNRCLTEMQLNREIEKQEGARN